MVDPGGGSGDERDEGAVRDGAVPRFPGGYVRGRGECIWLGSGTAGDVDEHERGDEVVDADPIDAGPAWSTVQWRVHVGAGVLAEAELVHEELRRCGDAAHPEERIAGPLWEVLVECVGEVEDPAGPSGGRGGGVVVVHRHSLHDGPELP
nr:hypothetical protein [Tomitella cavernea]